MVDSDRPQDGSAVSAGGDDGEFEALVPEPSHPIHRPLERLDETLLDRPLHHRVLAIAQPADRPVARRLGRVAPGEADAARLQETADAVVPRPAVYVALVVGVDV